MTQLQIVVTSIITLLNKFQLSFIPSYSGVFERLAMQSPIITVLYNLFMGGVDGFDRLKLNRRGSLELSIICRSWVKIYLLALFDWH